MLTTVTPLATFRNETPSPFCPGCGHERLIKALDKALVTHQPDPRDVVIVTASGPAQAALYTAQIEACRRHERLAATTAPIDRLTSLLTDGTVGTNFDPQPASQDVDGDSALDYAFGFS